MHSTWFTIFVLVAAVATGAVLTDSKPTEKSKPPTNSTREINQATSTSITPTASAQSSEGGDIEDDGGTESSPRKRTIEQTIGYGYRYNTVLRPVTSASSTSSVVSPVSRGRQSPYQQRNTISVTPSPTPASYYFQHQAIQNTSPKTIHRFNPSYTAYPRTYSRPEPSETRPVTESPIPITATVQPAHHDLYREAFTFDEAVPNPYHVAPRAEPQFIAPQALLLAPAGHSGHQQVIPVLILRLDTPAPFPYPMLAMHILRDDMAKLYAAQADSAAHLVHQYVEPASHEAPTLTYYVPTETNQYIDKSRRVQAVSTMQQERYRTPQNEHIAISKIPVRRPAVSGTPGVSNSGVSEVSGVSGTPQEARTEVTIHHSPGMTAQDYKESIEEQEEA